MNYIYGASVQLLAAVFVFWQSKGANFKTGSGESGNGNGKQGIFITWNLKIWGILNTRKRLIKYGPSFY